MENIVFLALQCEACSSDMYMCNTCMYMYTYRITFIISDYIIHVGVMAQTCLSKTYHCIYSFTLQPSTYDDIFSPYYSKGGGVATATTDTHTLLRYVTVYMCKIGYMFVLYGSASIRNKSASGVYARMMTYMCSFARHVYITPFCH